MNCKPNDMAIAKKTAFGKNVGKIVTVIRADDFGESDMWMIECPHFPGPIGGLWRCYDSWLIPIRPGDLQDEVTEDKKVAA